MFGRRIDDVVGANDQCDIGIGEFVVDGIDVIKPIIGHIGFG